MKARFSEFAKPYLMQGISKSNLKFDQIINVERITEKVYRVLEYKPESQNFFHKDYLDILTPIEILEDFLKNE